MRAGVSYLFLLTLLVSWRPTMASETSATRESAAPSGVSGWGTLSAEQSRLRLEHARELLGSRYKKSVVRTGEKIRKVNGDVYRWTRRALPAKYRRMSHKVAQSIIDVSHQHGFDPVLVMSIIQTESSFNPEMIGGVGEIGLMQIRPATAEWMAGKVGIRWSGEKALLDPLYNIRIGVAYLAWLREYFDSHARLYLAAYNMGQNNVRGLLANEKWPSEYPSKVMKFYVDYYAELAEKVPQPAPTTTPAGEAVSEARAVAAQAGAES